MAKHHWLIAFKNSTIKVKVLKTTGAGAGYKISAIYCCMVKEVIIKRYNAYYQGWCLAFGEHEVNRDEGRDVYWLVGEDRIGLALAPKLQRTLNQALLRQNEKTPELLLENAQIKVQGKLIYELRDVPDREGMQVFKEFLDCKDELHLFLTSHFCYPPGTRIITIAREKPSILLYKEMRPLKVLIS